MDAARRLFAEQGYPRTSVAEVAAAAGVAVNTVYASVGGKPQLIQAVTEFGSDDEAIDEVLRQVTAAEDGRTALLLLAHGTGAVTRRQNDLITFLLDNRTADPAVAAACEMATARYRERLDAVARHLHAQGRCRPGLSRAQAGQVLWFYFGMSAWRTVRDLGWGWDRAADWLGEQACSALLATPERD